MKNKRTSKRMMAAAFVLTGILAATQAAAAAHQFHLRPGTRQHFFRAAKLLPLRKHR